MFFDRTFHPDEANQAFTVGRLLETGRYTYRPSDHHGPTLYYAAAPLQRAFGHASTAELDGTLLRCTPLLFAVLALGFLAHALFMLRRSWTGVLAGVLLVGTVPFFVFFATDFIQEMLLVAFTLMMFWAGVGYVRATAAGADATPRRLKPSTWALLFGIGAGLAFATKETSVLAFAAAALTFGGLALFRRRTPAATSRRPLVGQHLLLAGLGFLLTAVLFFSSFCQNWTGVADAFTAAPLRYLGRAVGNAVASEGANWHVHPWWQHLLWLFCGNPPVPYTRGCGFTVDLAFANVIPLTVLATALLPLALFAALYRPLRARLSRPLTWTFFGVLLYTVLLIVLYSAIPYKTPWCTLQLLVPFLVAYALGLLLGRDVLREIALRRGASPRVAGLVATLAFLVPFLLVSLLAEHLPGLVRMARDPDAPTIPCNYAQASPEVRQLAACVDAALASAPPSAFVAVALPPADTWPFPWYNRRRESQTGYWTTFEDLVALEKKGVRPAVVIVPMSEGHLVQPLFPHLRHTMRFFMRPGVRVRVFW